MIEYAQSFLLWVWKVIKKLFWMLGLPPLLLDLASLYIPVRNLPKPIRILLEKGGSWRLTAILGGFGILLSAYSVYRENKRDLEGCRSDLQEFTERQPDIAVGFQEEDGRLARALRLRARALSKPDLDTYVERRRQRLIAKQEESSSSSFLPSPGLPKEPNPYYETELERYLVEYREWLLKIYRHATGMVFCVLPIVENRGDCTAGNVVLELVMPSAYEKPSEDLDPRRAGELQREGYSREEMLDTLYPEPQQPKAFITALDRIRPEIPGLRSLVQDQASYGVRGPRYEKKEGKWHIIYTLESLIQGRVEDSFEPFLVWLGEIGEATVWEIPVRIDVGEPPLNLERVLRIEIDVQVPE
jgi:hypothetical protein